MDHGRWSDRIFTKKPRSKRIKKESSEAKSFPKDRARGRKAMWRSFVRAVSRRGKVKT